jgi:hypothetical protein
MGGSKGTAFLKVGVFTINSGEYTGNDFSPSITLISSKQSQEKLERKLRNLDITTDMN